MKTLSLKERAKEYLEPVPKVVLMVTDTASCNLNCGCCYLPYKGIRSPQSTLRIVENLRDKFRLSIAGAENLLYPEYLKAYQAANQKYILTNGILLNQKPELFDLLKEYGIEEIQISYDPKDQKGGNKGLKEVVERVTRAAKEKGFWVRLGCVINAENYQEVDEMCDQVKATGADGVVFFNLMKSGNAKTQDKQALTEEQKEEFFQKVDEARKRFPKEEFEIRINGTFGPKKGSAGEKLAQENKYCPAGEQIFSVDPSDNVYGCPYLMETDPIGQLVDESRLEITNTLCNGDRSKCMADLLG
ncbi:MAG: radical SAM protein [Candidatus Gracilibacteria bacterium]|jgi:MoaA/NifB/PqqE/SkfB family radical SAM enzyme